jgi:hypothetical protein
MKAINTYYNGNYFRSRLEARWAVFFDLIGVKYTYEATGFKNEKGEYYLPDFHLHNVFLRRGDIDIKEYGINVKAADGIYLEIKPLSFTECTIKQAEWFTKPLVLFKDNPIKGIWIGQYDNDNYQLTPYWDDYMAFWKCHNCGQVKVEFLEGNYDYCPVCKSEGCDYTIEDAALKATMTRFEHLSHDSAI